MNNENSQMNPSAQEPQDTQSQQPTPETLPQTAPEANPQNTHSLIPASPAKDKDLIVLTGNGQKSLKLCVEEAYNSPNNTRYAWTHIGISNLYADIFSRIVRYVADQKEWFVFNGKCWTKDRGEVMEFCKTFTEEVQKYSKDTSHLMPKKQQRYQHIFYRIREKHAKEFGPVLPENMTLHTMRHTFCTKMALAGMNPKSLQYIMGHANIKITMDYYAHSDPSVAMDDLRRV